MRRLTNKSYRQYGKLSRYNNVPYYYNVVNNKYVYGTSSQLDDSTPYVYHVVEHGDTYDSISLTYYNNPTYFWVICAFNRIQDPFDHPVEGIKLKIPNMTALQFDE